MDHTEAREALDAVQGAREQLARAVDCPPWRHAAFGAVMAALIAANVVPRPFFAPLFIVSMAATVWLTLGDRRRSGTFVNGWRRGRTLPLSGGLFVALLGLIFVARHGRAEMAVSSEGLLAIALAFVIGTAASVLWQRIYLAELREGAGS